jgi:hypothetical protein
MGVTAITPTRNIAKNAGEPPVDDSVLGIIAPMARLSFVYSQGLASAAVVEIKDNGLASRG